MERLNVTQTIVTTRIMNLEEQLKVARKATYDIVLLAGGLGTRMYGVDKGLVRLDNRTFAEWVLTAFDGLKARPIIVANRHLDEYEKLIAQRNGVVVQDAVANSHGPLGGLLAASRHLRSEWVFIVPCDTPLLDSRFPERMLTASCSSTGAAVSKQEDGFVAHDGERLQAMHLMVRKEAFERLPELDSNRGKAPGLLHWIKMLSLLRVDFSDCPALFNNVNTEEQLESLRVAGRRFRDYI